MGIVWIVRQRLPVKSDCLLRIPGLQILTGLIGRDACHILPHVFGLFLLQGFQFLASLIRLSQRAKNGCQLKACFAGAGIQCERLFQLNPRFGELPLSSEHEAQVIARLGMLRIQGHGLTQDLLGIGIIAHASFHHSVKIQSFEIVRMVLEIIPDDGRGFLELRDRAQGFHIREASFIVGWVEAQRLLEFLRCLPESLLLRIDNAQVHVSLGISWVLFDNRGECLQGFIRIAILRISDSQIQLQYFIGRRILEFGDCRRISALRNQRFRQSIKRGHRPGILFQNPP